MTNYYTIENGKITGVDTDKNKLRRVTPPNIDILETDRLLVLSDDGTEFIFADTEEYEQQQINKRKQEFNKEFFLTSLGYIRRQVNMNTGEKKDFLSDLLPTISMAVTTGQEVPIITYKEPDFNQEVTLEYMESLQEIKKVTLQFINECALQVSKDFLPTPLVVNNDEGNIEL